MQAGKNLFKYFLKYCGDPAATAHACYGKSYKVVAKQNFRNNILQKERMNSGWRYQQIAKLGAIASKRFLSVSDVGTSEADFNVEIETRQHKEKVTIYISIKNRSNTMGGQDWPKAISALEKVAQSDKNRNSPYLCVFGIVMEKGQRNIRCNQKSKIPYSVNTEIWLSDFFWPFFLNYSYEEIIQAVLEVLIEMDDKDEIDSEIPEKIIETFGQECYRNELTDDSGIFNNVYRLASMFVGAVKPL